MSSLDDELALFESEIAQIETNSNSPQVETHVGYDNATISAAPEPVSNGNGQAATSSAPEQPVTTAAPAYSPFIASSLARGPGLPPPVPPQMLVPPQLRAPAVSSLASSIGTGRPQVSSMMPPTATIEGAPALYEAPALNSVPLEMLRTQALQSDIDKMHFKRQTDPLKKRIKEQQSKKKFVRSGGGQVWEDPSLAEWDENDFRIFCGDLGNEVSDELLAKAFRKYPSFQKAKVIRESRSNKSKGYGFVSFRESDDYVRAMREMDGKYVGNRPIKLRKSSWKDRNLDVIKKKKQKKKELGII